MAIWSVIVQPSTEPLTLSEAKNYLRIASVVVADDSFIESLIVSARSYVERVTGRALINQTIAEYFDSFPPFVPGKLLSGRLISLYVCPLVSISDSGISYVPENGTPLSYTVWLNTLNSNFFIDTVSGGRGIGPSRICLREGVEWPDIEVYTNSVRIEYVAGYGPTASDVPGPLKMAMYKLISEWYYNPSAKDPFLLVADLLNPYKVYK